MTKEAVENGKKMAAVSYLTLIGTLIAWSVNSDTTDGRTKNPFTSFHIRQALGINVMFIVVGILISGIDSWWATAPFYLFCVVLWGFGFAGAIGGKITIAPIVGPVFQRLFKKII